MPYETINHLIRDIKPDKKHWINRESIKFTKKSIYERTQVTLQHIPEEFVNRRIVCPKKHSFRPNWLEKRHPISVFFSSEKGYLRQLSVQMKCPDCATVFEISIPQTTINRELNVYGDEAFRYVDDKTIIVYSLVSFQGQEIQKKSFEKEFLEIKRELLPKYDPNIWVVHMTELLSEDKKIKSKYLKNVSQDEIYKFLDKLLDLIKRYTISKDMLAYCGVGIAEGDIQRNNQAKITCQSEIYNSALINFIMDSTKVGLMPKLYFERTDSDGWASDLFDGGRLTLLWPYITHNIPVMSPKFKRPSYSLYLEVADIISFIVARYIFCIGSRVTGKNIFPKYDPSLIGLIKYIYTCGDGHWNYRIQKTFPSENMFKNTLWEPYI